MCIHLYRNDLVLLCPEHIVEVEPRCPFLPDHEPHEPMLDRSDILSSDVVATKIGYLVFTCCHYNYRPLVLYNAVHLQALGSWCWQRQRPHRTGWWDGNGITSNMLLEANKISIKREANITKLKECWHILTLVLAMHSLPLGSCWFQETARALRIPLHWHSLKQHWESSQADMFLRSLTSLMPSRHPRQDHRYPPTPLASIAAAPHQQPLLGQLDVPPICAMWGFHGGIFQGYPRPRTSESTRRAQESWASKKLWFWLFLWKWNHMPQLCSLH